MNRIFRLPERGQGRRAISARFQKTAEPPFSFESGETPLLPEPDNLITSFHPRIMKKHSSWLSDFV